MFIENDITYNDASDYSAQNAELAWHGEEDNLKAMNCTYLICVLEDGRVWGTAHKRSSFFDSVNEAKDAAQKHYKNYDWSGKWLL